VKALLRLAAILMLALGLGLPALAQQPAQPAPAQPAPVAAPAPAPAPAQDGPTKVKIGIYINDIQSLDLRNHSFVGDVYIWFRNPDPALKPGSTFELMNMFAPDDHVQKAFYDQPQPQPDGSTYELFRHQGPFSAKFNIRTFPFDSHNLTVEIEDQESTAERLIYEVDEVSMNPNMKLPGFNIGKPTLTILNQPYPTAFGDLANPKAEPYSRAIVSVPISRPLLAGIIKSLLPVFIVVLVAAASLLLSPSHVEARVGLAITALLTLVALQFNATSGLPDVSYLLMLDQVYLASYAFVLLVIGLLVQGTGKDDAAQAESGAAAEILPRAGWLAAFLAVLLYAAVIGVVLLVNLTQAGEA
jgi:hypothetical protein